MKLRLKSTRKVKLVRKKVTKWGLKVYHFSFPYQLNGSFLKAQHRKVITFQVKESLDSPLKKELRRSDFLFDGGYVGAKAPLLSTSKIKRK